MKQETMARTIIETMMNKFLRDMEDDPDRSIRNLIDLGINFARGRFQKEFFHVLQEMLSNERSAYYDLAKQVAARTDHEILKTFGMNMGFQACTLGARLIRENEERWNFNIPWAYQLMFGEQGLSPEAAEKIIREGRELGTYVYILFGAGNIKKQHLELLSRYGDCAFILFTTPRMILGGLMTELLQVHNLLVLVEHQEQGMEETVDELQKHGFLYGLYEECPSKNQETLWAPAHLERIAALGAACYVLMPEKVQDFHFKEDESRKRAVSRIRGEQEYPLILIDFVSDIQQIDRIISNDSCAVAFDTRGNVCTDTGICRSCYERSLFEILEQVTKKRP